MTGLDDLKLIHQRDASDALGIAEKQWQQLTHEYNPGDINIDTERVRNVVVAGMGGSALAATMFASWPGVSIPFEVWRSYDAPSYVGEHTLFIASSYSGNTEETLSAIEYAQKRGCQIIVIAAGGTLAEVAKDNSYPYYAIPEGYQPRMAAFYNFAALAQAFSRLGLIESSSVQELQEAAVWLGGQAKACTPTVPTKDNLAKQIALDVCGSSIVVYAGPALYPAAYKWKISFNENAKNIAWCNQFPEFNHNEFLGWTSHPVEKPYKVISITGSVENPRVLKRFDVTERLLSGQKPTAIEVKAEGDTRLKQLLWAIQLGDFVSLYTSLLNGLDPTPVDKIEQFKKLLTED